MINVGEIANEVESMYNIEYRDPFDPAYGDPERTTETQAKAWDKLQKGIDRIGIVGAKGAGKTFFGACFAFHIGQLNPGARILLCASTDRQAKDAAGSELEKVARILGYDIEYFRTKKTTAQERSVFYVIDLDGSGMDEGMVFYVFVRSMEAVDALEGSEYDAAWYEELQQMSKDDFTTANTRVRGTRVVDDIDEKRPVFAAGMTDAPGHWMYKMLEENMDFGVEDEFDSEEHKGILFEPDLFENAKNVGKATIEEYIETLDTDKVQRWVYGKRTAPRSNIACYEYRTHRHRNGRMSELLAHYDPRRELFISIDFNISPMTGIAFQEKPFNHKWLDDNIVVRYRGPGNVAYVEEYDPDLDVTDYADADPIETYDRIEDYAEPDIKVLAQVDEWEVWPDNPEGGGTPGLMRNISKDYSTHHPEIIIVGDARGDSRASRMGQTDWDIVEEHAVNNLYDAVVIRGVESDMDLKKGKTTYYNPPVRESLNTVNALLMNANRESRICFLSDSDLESGGLSGSVSTIKTGNSGKIDKKPDRSQDREVSRSHFIDTLRYLVWYWTDKGRTVSKGANGEMDVSTQNEGTNERQDEYMNYTNEEAEDQNNPYDNEWLL